MKLYNIKYHLVLVLLLLTELTQAQTDFDDDVTDTAAPIDENLFLLGIAGLLFAFFVYRNYIKKEHL